MADVKHFDVVILGTGPAGIQAAIHAARRKVSVLVLGKGAKSSLYNAHVENFAFLFNVSGDELILVGRQQAESFGAVFLEEDVVKTNKTDNGFQLSIESGTVIHGKTLIIATGTSRNKLNVAGEKEYLGRGVSYCVECDSHFFKDAKVAIVGSESAAADGALTLLNVASKIHWIVDKPQIDPSVEKEIRASDIVIHEGKKVKTIKGEKHVSSIILDDDTTLDVEGIFIELGAKGVMELATAFGIRLDDEMKFIMTDKDQKTNVPGIYAAGDVCGPPWQMAKAVGEGCVAGLKAAAFAKKLK